MICPVKQPRRYEAQQERQLAERGRALAPSLTAAAASKRMGISSLRAEQIAAKFGYTYQPARKQ